MRPLNSAIDQKIATGLASELAHRDTGLNRSPRAGRNQLTPSDLRKIYRSVLSGTKCVHPAPVFDAISGRFAQDLGFELSVMGGSVASMAVLAAPDRFVLTLPELVEQARRICRAGSPPLLVDGDHGHGNALNVMRTVQELESAGVSAVMLEDTLIPPAFGATDAAALISRDEAVGKLKAAVAARGDPDFVIIARCGAIPIEGLDAAISRAKAYEVAGADALMFTRVKSYEQLDAIAAAVSLPIVLGTIPLQIRDLAILASKRVRISLLGHQPFSAIIQASYATLKSLRQGTQPEALANLAPEGLEEEITREAQYSQWAKEYLGG